MPLTFPVCVFAVSVYPEQVPGLEQSAISPSPLDRLLLKMRYVPLNPSEVIPLQGQLCIASPSPRFRVRR